MDVIYIARVIERRYWQIVLPHASHKWWLIYNGRPTTKSIHLSSTGPLLIYHCTPKYGVIIIKASTCRRTNIFGETIKKMLKLRENWQYKCVLDTLNDHTNGFPKQVSDKPSPVYNGYPARRCNHASRHYHQYELLIAPQVWSVPIKITIITKTWNGHTQWPSAIYNDPKQLGNSPS
jgi:hypothetical protein